MPYRTNTNKKKAGMAMLKRLQRKLPGGKRDETEW